MMCRMHNEMVTVASEGAEGQMIVSAAQQELAMTSLVEQLKATRAKRQAAAKGEVQSDLQNLEALLMQQVTDMNAIAQDVQQFSPMQQEAVKHEPQPIAFKSSNNAALRELLKPAVNAPAVKEMRWCSSNLQKVMAPTTSDNWLQQAAGAAHNGKVLGYGGHTPREEVSSGPLHSQRNAAREAPEATLSQSTQLELQGALTASEPTEDAHPTATVIGAVRSALGATLEERRMKKRNQLFTSMITSLDKERQELATARTGMTQHLETSQKEDKVAAAEIALQKEIAAVQDEIQELQLHVPPARQVTREVANPEYAIPRTPEASSGNLVMDLMNARDSLESKRTEDDGLMALLR